jgi:hypothetical protein
MKFLAFGICVQFLILMPIQPREVSNAMTEFDRLEKKWLEEAGPLWVSSNHDDYMCLAPARQLVKRGHAVIPEVLKRLEGTLGPVPTAPESWRSTYWLPWHLIFIEITGRQLRGDEEYLRLVREHFRSQGKEYDDSLDETFGPTYVQEVAVPLWKAWWIEEQKRKGQEEQKD